MNAAISATSFLIEAEATSPGGYYGPGYYGVNTSLFKSFPVFREQNLQFIAEVFNLFNITNVRGFNNNNYSGYLNDITSSEFNKPLSTAGKFFGSGGARAFQFALRYSF